MSESIRGVILAGGTGSRLLPLTKHINKHLLPVGTKPMIYHAIEKLVQAGIHEIMIVTGTEHMGMVVQSVGSGSVFDCHINYAVQDRAFGIPDAIALAKIFCDNKRFCVILGDNIFTDPIDTYVENFKNQDGGSRIVLKSVSDMERFGVAIVNKNKRIVEIIEKPKLTERPIPSELTGYAITGIYFFSPSVFEVINHLVPSARNELEVTDIHTSYLAKGQLTYDIMNGPWTDAGTIESLKRADSLFR